MNNFVQKIFVGVLIISLKVIMILSEFPIINDSQYFNNYTDFESTFTPSSGYQIFMNIPHQ